MDASIRVIHEKCIYPVVRVRTDKAGGSGTIIYSKLREGAEEEEYQTFILTNHHVIEEAIVTKEDWDSVLKKNIRKEFLSPVSVEIFDYIRSEVNSANSHSADIIAYDKAHDLAILKLDSPKKSEYVAELVDRKDVKNLYLAMDLCCVGCSLLHVPLISMGKLTSLKEIIENKLYVLSSTDGYLGNSGGALYIQDSHRLIGVPSRVQAKQLGFGVDLITWLMFSSHPKRIYEFLDEQEMMFLYDNTDTFERAVERREQKRKKAIWESLTSGGGPTAAAKE
jgi:S1-C subfamily serine protease